MVENFDSSKWVIDLKVSIPCIMSNKDIVVTHVIEGEFIQAQ